MFATTQRQRRYEWSTAGAFTALEQLCLKAYDRIVGLQLADLVVDGCIVKRFPLQAGARWVIERTNSWHNRGFKKLAMCTERHTRLIEAFIVLVSAIIIVCRLIRAAWAPHRGDARPTKRP